MRDTRDNSVNIICLHLSQHLAAAPYALKQDELAKVSDTSVIGSPSPPAGAAHCVPYCLIPAPVCARLLFIKNYSLTLLHVPISLGAATKRRRPDCSFSSCRSTEVFDDSGTLVDLLFSAHHVDAQMNFRPPF